MLTHKYAEANGIRLHYVTTGKGKLLLFVHGFPEFWYAWKNQLVEFGRDYQAVAPDMRGYNLSSKPTEVEQYQVQYLVEDLRALVEKLGHDTCILAGHDWGGVVAWFFAMTHPEYVEKLIIINAPHPAIFQRELRENPAQQQASRYILLYRSPKAEQMLSANNYEVLVQRVLGEGLKQGFFTDEDRKAYLAAWSQPGALTGGFNYYPAARLAPPSGHEQEPPHPTCALSMAAYLPTLVIWGENDTALLTGNLEGLDMFVPDLTIKRIPEGTHWVIHEQPALINTSIREFITDPARPLDL